MERLKKVIEQYSRWTDLTIYTERIEAHVSADFSQSAENAKALLETIRSKVPGIAIRTTLIAGHPGETEKDFQDLLDFVERSRFERLGIFTYSHEENTHSYSFKDDITPQVKQERADAVMELQESISLEHNRKLIGQKLQVIIDRKEGDYFIGRTEFDSPEVDNEVLIKVTDNYLPIGDFVDVKITGASEFDLIGEH